MQQHCAQRGAAMLLAALLFLALLASGAARVSTGRSLQASPSPKLTSSNDNAGILNLHNRYRAVHHAPPLTWDTTLETAARNWANTMLSRCQFAHSPYSYGENIAAGYNDWSTIAYNWYKEVYNYNFASPPDSVFGSGSIGHFTQMVWIGTKRLGCATVAAPCVYGRVWVCEYDPPGNWGGQFGANVKAP